METMLKRKIILNIHPFLFALVSLLFIYFQVMLETSPDEIFRPFVILSLGLVLLYPLAVKFAKSWEWGGILLTILVLGLFFQPEHFVIASTLAAFFIFLCFLYFKLTKRSFLVTHVSLSLTFASFFIVAAQIIVLLFYITPIPFSYYKAMVSRSSSNTILLPESSNTLKPDIYYIVLDGYPRADILKEIYNFDNSEFVENLEGLGFIVPENVRSNYPRTALSISSTLDMQYWDTISPDMDGVPFWWPAKPVMRHSRVRESLEAIGYQSISFASDWDITDNPTVDMYIKPYPARLTGYENYIAVTTPLKLFLTPFQNIAPVMSNEVHRHYILNIMDNLKTIPNIDGPKFVFAHIVLPHPPIVFNEDGSPVDSSEEFYFGASMWSREDGYIAQLEFLNDYLPPVVETIMRESKTPPIIILQADHGSALHFSFSSLETDCLKERFSIFGAYYLPGKPLKAIPQNLTPVNLFRIVFNEYFGTKMPLLENRNYYTQGGKMFDDMQDVTAVVGSACTFPRSTH